MLGDQTNIIINSSMQQPSRKLGVLLGNYVVFALIMGVCVNIRIARPAPPRPALAPTLMPVSTVAPQRPITPAVEAIEIITTEPTCSLPDLMLDQHISSNGRYDETQWAASGGMACRIEPDTCAYHRLIGLVEPTIMFKREEAPPFDIEDILMHPKMLTPLLRLNRLVQTEWDGAIQLRITDTYDSLLEHDLNQTDPTRKYSLHFEGRAIDLTTWPINRNLYGRLCALAHCAGFDWVHNEGDHCHASINAESLCWQCRE